MDVARIHLKKARLFAKVTNRQFVYLIPSLSVQKMRMVVESVLVYPRRGVNTICTSARRGIEGFAYTTGPMENAPQGQCGGLLKLTSASICPIKSKCTLGLPSEMSARIRLTLHYGQTNFPLPWEKINTLYQRSTLWMRGSRSFLVKPHLATMSQISRRLINPSFLLFTNSSPNKTEH